MADTYDVLVGFINLYTPDVIVGYTRDDQTVIKRCSNLINGLVTLHICGQYEV